MHVPSCQALAHAARVAPTGANAPCQTRLARKRGSAVGGATATTVPERRKESRPNSCACNDVPHEVPRCCCPPGPLSSDNAGCQHKC